MARENSFLRPSNASLSNSKNPAKSFSGFVVESNVKSRIDKSFLRASIGFTR